MNISIKVITHTPEIIYNVPSLIGEIQINDFKEEFVMSLAYWSLEDYEKQWKDGLERAKKGYKSCLVTTVQDPNKSPFVDWWLLYKVNHKIFIQNQILFGRMYKKIVGKKIFIPKTCSRYVPPREVPRRRSDDLEVSEWIVDLPKEYSRKR